MATVNLGRIKPVFRGAYSGSTAYVIDDIVTHGNESFICIQAHGAGAQATSVTAYWTKLAAKGTDGTDVGTTITTQGDILFRDGSGLQRLAKGTAAQSLIMNAGATAPEWGAGGITWQTVITADPNNAVAGRGYFCNTTGAAFTVTLPTSAVIGNKISFIDYAATFDTNNLTVGRNSHKIQGASSNLIVATERAGFSLVYVDATQGWLLTEK